MNSFEVLLLALALGVDCLVVSFSQGLIFRRDRLKTALKLAVTMGLFQGIMPVFGYIGADYVRMLLEPYSRWIVFVVFMLLGLQFVLESMSKTKSEEVKCIGVRCLIALGIATSVDALISGVTLNLTGAILIPSCITIGLTSLVMSFGGFGMTNAFRKLPAKYLQLAGGLILMFLAAKTFFC